MYDTYIFFLILTVGGASGTMTYPGGAQVLVTRRCTSVGLWVLLGTIMCLVRCHAIYTGPEPTPPSSGVAPPLGQ